MIKLWKRYSGQPYRAEKTDRNVRKALTAYENEVARCTRPSHEDYKYYGAMGIRVEYTKKEFIGWYLWQLSRNTDLKRPSINRLDHTKNYSFGNIEMMELSVNSGERNTRHLPIWSTAVNVLTKNNEIIATFKTARSCASYFNISETYLKSLAKQRKGIKGSSIIFDSKIK